MEPSANILQNPAFDVKIALLESLPFELQPLLLCLS